MSALGGIYTALKTLIGADATTAALLAASPGAWVGTNGKAIYDDGAAPQAGSMPYLTIGAGTEIPMSSLAQNGWNCTLQVKVTAQGAEAIGQAIVNSLSALLFPMPRRYLTVAGFSTAVIQEFIVQPTLVTTIAGVVTREWPVILRVYAR